jgi:3-deoxy-manno-octulosonate cytidylyltransferase (CMP-KDO synthetase)
MVVRVAERAARSGAQRVVVATDDARIAAACDAHRVECIRTRADHATGTDRIAEACELLRLPPGTVVVNVQGDEPLIEPGLVSAVATACHPISRREEVFNPNVVKVILDARGFALYFSRAPMPWAREAWKDGPQDAPAGLPCYRHIGLYAYRAGFLARYAGLEACSIEAFEALEQLRVLWHGHRIAVAISETAAPPGVDTPQDLERLRRLAVSWQ